MDPALEFASAITPILGARGTRPSGVARCDFHMDDLDLPASGPALDPEIARILRAWFDVIIDELPPDALRLVRQQCFRAERTPANMEIAGTIEPRLAKFPG
jgi:hypothetical protein